MNKIQIKNLTKEFKSGAGVFDLNFDINKNDVIGFVGDNGAGKTTTIKLLFNTLKKDSGEILFDGISNDKDNDLSKNIAFFPDQNNYPKDMRIIDFISYNGELSGMKHKDAVNKAKEIMIDLNLEKYLKSTFNELSVGMQKRALLGSTLISKPEVIILDEPTANVDVDSRIEFLSILKKLTNNGVTLLITTHNIEELETLINKLIIINQGKIVYNDKFDSKKDKIAVIYKEHVKKKGINEESLINYGK